MIDKQDSLRNWRTQINEIDLEIIRLLASRMDKVQLIGGHKRKNNLSALNERRRKWVLKNWLNEGSKYGLNEIFLTELYTVIHNYSLESERNEK